MAEANLKIKTTYSSDTIEAGGLGAGAAGIAGQPGTRNDASLKAAFSGSPLVGYSEAEIKAGGEEDALDYSDPAALKTWFINNVVKGDIEDKSYGLGKYNLDYEQAPNLGNVERGGEGMPATPFVPNPTSPGEGSTNASTQEPASDAFISKQTPDGAAFSGKNITQAANLADSAKEIVDRITPPRRA
jgi:hypothetical protein